MDAESVVQAPRLQIHTRERRFLVDEPAVIEAVLRARGAPIEYVPGQEESRILTVYVDTAAGTWSRGRGATKFRCKNYGNPSVWWFEMKRRVGNVVDKWRRPVSPDVLHDVLEGSRRGDAIGRFVGTEPLAAVAVVMYRRTAFEWDGLRVTVDRGVEFFKPDALNPGARLGGLARGIIEVKRDGPLPEWLVGPLKGRRARDFSKSKCALALLPKGYTSSG